MDLGLIYCERELGVLLSEFVDGNALHLNY